MSDPKHARAILLLFAYQPAYGTKQPRKELLVVLSVVLPEGSGEEP